MNGRNGARWRHDGGWVPAARHASLVTLMLAVAVLGAGCGSKKATVTVIETSPATASPTGAPTTPAQAGGTASTVSTAPTTAPTTGGQPIAKGQPKPPDAQFCQGTKGDQVRAADKNAMTAFNKADGKSFESAANKALSISQDAPPGSACVKDSLNGIVLLAQDGASNLKGIDLQSLIARIHKFEDDHGIEHP